MIALLYNGQVWRTSLFDDEMDKCGFVSSKTWFMSTFISLREYAI